ncbi:uncharacterized protein BXIN_2951 [Babesia sp. Xinjiang]|uniref:uncharacterized protein n=1 Tax=Babesia sp. Xinjiang TaxID=462227 RepID=UPI000A216104|nr:uncharacterized protein BXIN_2951 [Babesia sp. Xinjiang]ORM39486.1 hypothetical protein BXIN_2951 [Babesia sp. Xinjiang]
MDVDLKFDELCKEIYTYYSNNAVKAQGSRTAIMLRATGEPWSREEIAQYTSCRNPNITFNEFKRIARTKRFGGPAASGTAVCLYIGRNMLLQGAKQALVDDYGNVINLSVNECREIVDAYKTIVELRKDAGDDMNNTTIQLNYLKHLLTHLGDAIPQHILKLIRTDQYAYRGTVSIRTMLKMLGRRE